MNNFHITQDSLQLKLNKLREGVVIMSNVYSVTHMSWPNVSDLVKFKTSADCTASGSNHFLIVKSPDTLEDANSVDQEVAFYQATSKQWHKNIKGCA